MCTQIASIHTVGVEYEYSQLNYYLFKTHTRHMRAIIQCIWIGIGFMYSWDHYKQKLHDKSDYVYTYILTFIDFYAHTHIYIYLHKHRERERYLIYIYILYTKFPSIASRIYPEIEALRHTEQLLRKPLASSWTSFLGVPKRWKRREKMVQWCGIYMDLYNDLYGFIFIYMDWYGFI